MFDTAGLETEAVEVMHNEWTGHLPANRTPRLDSMKIGPHTAYDNVYLKKSSTYTAQVWVTDADKDRL